MRKIILPVYVALASLLFCYVLARGHLVGFTHDESLSYTIINGSQQWTNTANNHWLNTFLAKKSVRFFGANDFTLRLPNILSFGFFLWYGARFFRRYATSPWSVLAVFPIIFLNPLAIDFFGLFRGYGLALSFFMASLFHCLNLLKKENHSDCFFAITWGVLSIYSNYSFIVPVFSLQASFAFYFIWKNNFRAPMKFVAYSLAGICSLLPAAFHIAVLRKNKELYAGGSQNIFEDTLLPCLQQALPIGISPYAHWAIIASCLVLLGFGAFYQKKQEQIFIALIAFFLIVAPTAANWWLNVNFPPGRAGIYWPLIFGIGLFFILERYFLLPKKTWNMPVIFLTSLIGLVFLVNFFGTVNFRSTILWETDSNTKFALEYLNKNIDPLKKHTIGTYWLHEPVFNYYRATKYNGWLAPVTRGHGLEESDFYYLEKKRMELVAPYCTDTLRYFPKTKFILLKSCVKTQDIPSNREPD